MDKIQHVENNLKMVLKHWGFGEICSSIYATLALSDRPLTAKEIAKHINYAYTTTINALNHSIGLRYINKMRHGRNNVYYISSGLGDIIKDRLGYFLETLEETERSIKKLDQGYREKLKTTLKIVTDAISVLKKMKKVEARA